MLKWIGIMQIMTGPLLPFGASAETAGAWSAVHGASVESQLTLAPGRNTILDAPWSDRPLNWVRLVLEVQGPARVLPSIVGFKAGRVATRLLAPSCCEPSAAETMTCSQAVWMGEDIDHILVLAFNWNEAPTKATVRALDAVTTSRELTGDPARPARARELLDRIKATYYLTDLVDWKGLWAATEPIIVRAAPDGLDPLPYFVLDVLARLPEKRHSRVLRKARAGADARLPSCDATDGGARTVLSMPGTPDEATAERRYISAAQNCLMRAQGTVTLDMRECGGGNAQVLLAALAPIIPDGIQLKYRHPDGRDERVVLSRTSVVVEDYRIDFGAAVPFLEQLEVSVLIGPHCASSCEVVLLPLRRRFELMGTSTAGLTTSNEITPINDEFDLMLTTAHIVDADGSVVQGPIHPGSPSRSRQASP